MHRHGHLEQKLLNDFQHDFPCVPTPYRTIADRLAVSEATVLSVFSDLIANGSISRIGPVFSPGSIGVSTLAALAVPPHLLESVATWVSSFPETNHNYEREDRFNLWFVVTASNSGRLMGLLAEIADMTRLPMLTLPLIEQFHIDLGFDMIQPRIKPKREASEQSDNQSSPPIDLSEWQHQLIAKLQQGIPLASRPFIQMWPDDPSREQETLKQILNWKKAGTIKRFGVVVRHHELGFDSNAMVVWDVPEDQVGELGRLAAQMPEVTLCYRRPRQLPDWPYNLFCMIHGRSRAEVMEKINELSEFTRLCNFSSKVLFSKKRYKQRGARYVFN